MVRPSRPCTVLTSAHLASTASVFGPVEAPPCVRHTALPLQAALRHCWPDLLDRAWQRGVTLASAPGSEDHKAGQPAPALLRTRRCAPAPDCVAAWLAASLARFGTVGALDPFGPSGGVVLRDNGKLPCRRPLDSSSGYQWSSTGLSSARHIRRTQRAMA